MNHDMWENKAKEVLRFDNNNNEEDDLVETVEGAPAPASGQHNSKKPNANNLIEPIGNIADQNNEIDKNININHNMKNNNEKIEKEQAHDVDYDDDNSKNINNNKNNKEIENKHIDDNAKPNVFIKLKQMNNNNYNNNNNENNEYNKNLSEQT